MHGQVANIVHRQCVNQSVRTVTSPTAPIHQTLVHFFPIHHHCSRTSKTPTIMSNLEDFTQDHTAPPDISRSSSRALDIPEIARHVIDFFHDDKHTLRQCSLVCRAWLPLASRHLFKKWSWPPCRHAFGVARLRSGCRCWFLTGSHEQFWSILLEVLQATERLRINLRSLTVSFNVTIIQDIGYSGRIRIAEYNYKTKPSELLAVVNSLPSLKSLYLRWPTFSPDTIPVDLIAGRHTRTLEELTIAYSGASSADQLAVFQTILRAFGRISTVYSRNISWYGPDNYLAVVANTSELTEINTLDVYNSTSQALVQFLRAVAASAEPSSISHLAISYHNDTASSVALAPALQALPNLQTLSLSGLHATSILRQDVTHLFPRLRTLTISGFIAVRGDSPLASWQSLRNVAACTIPGIEELVLRFSLTGAYAPVSDDTIVSALQGCDWTLLDAVFVAYSEPRVTLRLVLGVETKSRLPTALRLLEDTARALMPARVAEGIRLCVSSEL